MHRLTVLLALTILFSGCSGPGPGDHAGSAPESIPEDNVNETVSPSLLHFEDEFRDQLTSVELPVQGIQLDGACRYAEAGQFTRIENATFTASWTSTIPNQELALLVNTFGGKDHEIRGQSPLELQFDSLDVPSELLFGVYAVAPAVNFQTQVTVTWSFEYTGAANPALIGASC